MGYDQHQQSSSSGALVGVVVAVLLIAVLGILVVVGAGLFFVQTSRVEVQTAMVAEERAVAEAHRAEATALRAVEEAQAEATPESRLNIVVTVDREGNVSHDGDQISLHDLRAQLVKLQEETGNALSVHINADSECPVKHIVPVLDVCKEVGDIDFRIVSSSGSDSPSDEGDAEN